MIKNLLYSHSYEKGIVFQSTHKSNYRELIEYEEEQTTKYVSSVNLTSKSIEINLSLDKNFMRLQTEILYNVYLKYVSLNTESNKPIYKIMKVVISDDTMDDIYEGSVENDILESYEINQMYENVRKDLYVKIEKRRDQLDSLLRDVDEKGSNLDNLNFIDDINNNFDKFFGKKYI